MHYIFILITLFCFQMNGFAQSTAKNDSSSVQVIVDKRMDLLTNKPVPHVEKKPIKPQVVKGFRIQVYYGTSRQDAADAKTMFMRKYPSVRSYLTYNNPQYRLKVGDFKTRAEADAFADGLRGMYKSVMIVSETINATNAKK